MSSELGILGVYREYQGQYQKVGILSSSENGTVFNYVQDYLRCPDAGQISLALPLQEAPFTKAETRVFFESLLPEGSMRKHIETSLHAGSSTYYLVLQALNTESVGALVFSENEDGFLQNRSYEEWSFASMKRFSEHPEHIAFEAGMTSRLSIAGAQAKLGLYHEGDDLTNGWFLPKGFAASNYIVKASTGLFAHQTVNEAFCLLVAKHCDFDVAQATLLPLEDKEPLLVIKRFDRLASKDSSVIDEHKVPQRIHQEDFCQAGGITPQLKYEPTDGHYANLGSRIIQQAVDHPFGDRCLFFNRLVFDFLIGNCDNHLKNHSLLWQKDWASCELAPLYDVTCTTMYPLLEREMGISLCASRRIDDVVGADICRTATSVGMPEDLGWQAYQDLCSSFDSALCAARDELKDFGAQGVDEIADFITQDSLPRMSLK